MSYSKADLNALFTTVCAIIAFGVCSSLGNPHDIIVNIFLEESNSDVTQIVQNAVDRYLFDHKNSSLETHIHLNFSFIGYNRVIGSFLDQERYFNLSTSTIHAAILVHISNHELILSSIMEKSNIVTIGLFQTDGIPRTQVRITHYIFL